MGLAPSRPRDPGQEIGTGIPDRNSGPAGFQPAMSRYRTESGKKNPAGVTAGFRSFGVRHIVGGDDGGHTQCVWRDPYSRFRGPRVIFVTRKKFFLRGCIVTWIFIPAPLPARARRRAPLRTGAGNRCIRCWPIAPACVIGLCYPEGRNRSAPRVRRTSVQAQFPRQMAHGGRLPQRAFRGAHCVSTRSGLSLRRLCAGPAGARRMKTRPAGNLPGNE